VWPHHYTKMVGLCGRLITLRGGLCGRIITLREEVCVAALLH